MGAAHPQPSAASPASPASSTHNPFEALRAQQIANSHSPRTRDQIGTFAHAFNPNKYPANSIVIPPQMTAAIGLPALTQDLYVKMMTASLSPSTSPSQAIFNPLRLLELRSNFAAPQPTTTALRRRIWERLGNARLTL